MKSLGGLKPAVYVEQLKYPDSHSLRYENLSKFLGLSGAR